jgi:hypothetical protein
MTRVQDPLGLQALESAVARLREAAAAPADTSSSKPWVELVSQLDAAHEAVELKMDLLRDRYAVLKRTSAQLADEVAWLRDQLDDLVSAQANEPDPGSAVEPAPAASNRQGFTGERRYADRWKGRQP